MFCNPSHFNEYVGIVRPKSSTWLPLILYVSWFISEQQICPNFRKYFWNSNFHFRIWRHHPFMGQNNVL